MKKTILTTCTILLLQFSRADEGMWLPFLLEQLNISEMQAMGFRLTAEDIYSVNAGSMKDGAVLFGGGCTGAVISNSGLVLTNHHCGFGSIFRLSTIENNYLKNGYWATPDKNTEIPCPGLSVTFIISIHDVTSQIIPFTDTATSEISRLQIIANRIAEIEKDAIAGTHYQAQIKPFYYGNAYYMFITEKFTDIRLVAAPPEALGNFGHETDNWMYPRHTADFSLFRIYAGKDNTPADYSPQNVPFTPRYHFPVSLNGVQENDFTMVYGFPGTTQQFLIPEAVDMQVNKLNTLRLGARDIRIGVMDKYMQHNDTLYLMYIKKKNDLENAYKKWKGETLGINVTNSLQKKEMQETEYLEWAQKTNSAYLENYSALEDNYTVLESLLETITLTRESIFGIEAISFAQRFDKLAQ
ncbi:MAG: S46 family peptidase, partial [Chitinophagales bacterium]